ncbi:MAG: hypothetical protein IIX52_07455 [Paludibacteraceae bacterium]|nr:hypothetical protein [Paludibacteraceae bacterium]
MDVFFVISWFLESYKNILIFFQKSGLKIWSVLKNALFLHPLSRTTVLSYKASIVAELLQRRFESKIFKIFCLKILQNQKPALSLQSVSEKSQIDSSISRLFRLRLYEVWHRLSIAKINFVSAFASHKLSPIRQKITVVIFLSSVL